MLLSFVFVLSASNTQLHSIVDTPTLKENSSVKSSINLKRNKMTSNNNSVSSLHAPQSKPIRQSMEQKISKAESLDTLSPCESICSDDLMMDFEYSSNNSSGGGCAGDGNNNENATTKINKIDENQLWNEFEQNGGGQFKDWSYLLKTSRNKCQDISM